MVVAAVAWRVTSMRTGSFRKVSTRRWISGGMVAEKNSVCRRGGSSLQMRSMSGMKPMSSMRSASSMTRISTPVSRILPRPKWSSRRPGVAISTSTPRSSLRSCSSGETPPISSATDELVVDAVFLEALLHLGGELARRGQDQRARHACPRASGFEPRQHRQHVAGGLAGAGLRDAEHVAAGHGDRDGLHLDGSGFGIAGGLDGSLHFRAEPELSEGCGLQKKVSPCVFT